MRILIAEDETIIRLDLRELLEKSGFDVVAEAKDGEEAVDLARSESPDLALLDVKMPKLDGIDAARQILDERPIPIVMVTAYGEQEIVSRAVEAGVFGYLVKPFRESDLLPRSRRLAHATRSSPRSGEASSLARRSPLARRSSGPRAAHGARRVDRTGCLRPASEGESDLGAAVEGRRRSPHRHARRPVRARCLAEARPEGEARYDAASRRSSSRRRRARRVAQTAAPTSTSGAAATASASATTASQASTSSARSRARSSREPPGAGVTPPSSVRLELDRRVSRLAGGGRPARAAPGAVPALRTLLEKTGAVGRARRAVQLHGERRDPGAEALELAVEAIERFLEVLDLDVLGDDGAGPERRVTASPLAPTARGASPRRPSAPSRTAPTGRTRRVAGDRARCVASESASVSSTASVRLAT